MILKTTYKMKPPPSVRLNTGHPLADKLVACYLFNEASGLKIFDKSCHGNTGTISGAAPSWTYGKFGKELSLPGTDEYVDFGNPIALGAVTCLWWMKTTFDWSVRKGVVGVTDSYEVITLEPISGRVRVRLSSGNYIVVSGCPADLSLYRQFALVLTGDGQNDIDNAKIYVDLKQLTLVSKIKSTAPDAWTEFIFGKNSYGILDCTVSQILLYNRILSASERALLYREPFCMFRRRR